MPKLLEAYKEIDPGALQHHKRAYALPITFQKRHVRALLELERQGDKLSVRLTYGGRSASLEILPSGGAFAAYWPFNEGWLADCSLLGLAIWCTRNWLDCTQPGQSDWVVIEGILREPAVSSTAPVQFAGFEASYGKPSGSDAYVPHTATDIRQLLHAVGQHPLRRHSLLLLRARYTRA